MNSGWKLALTLGCVLSGMVLTGCESTPDTLDQTIAKLIDSNRSRPPEEVAASLFNTDSPDARRAAIANLCYREWGFAEPYMKAYKTLATDPDPLVRAQAMRALGRSGKQEATETLVTGLKDKNEWVRRDAAVALNKVPDPKATEPMLEHLVSEPDGLTRAALALALQNHRGPKVVRGLVVALEDRNAAVVYRAWSSLKIITEREDLPMEYDAWAKEYKTTATTQPQ